MHPDPEKTLTTTETDRSTTMTDQNFLTEKLRDILNGGGSADDKIQAIHDDLLPVSPLPDPLFLAKATHPEHGEGIVTSHHPDGDGEVRFMVPDEAIDDGTDDQWVNPHTLTFHTPDHPVFLEAEEDYRSAPEDTIVAGNRAGPKVLVDGRWRDVYFKGFDHGEMAGTRRRVLRWGREA